MGRLFSRAIETAGLADCQARVRSGAGLPEAEIARLRAADLLLVAGLADEARAQFRGDDVRIVSRAHDRDKLALFDVTTDPHGPTGADVLREIALLRLATPADVSVAVSFDALGLELAQTALLFGADVLLGDLAGKRTLPLLDGPVARKKELAGLVERSGRRPHFEGDAEPSVNPEPSAHVESSIEAQP
jgi:2-iminoacetate synthase ThiH